MSSSATFELKSTVSPQDISRCVSKLWSGFGYYVDVHIYPDKPDRFFCTLDYVYGYPGEEDMLKSVISYLLGIASDRKIYYYRCAEFAPLDDDVYPILNIEVDDLFQQDLKPSISASLIQKYAIYRT